MLKRVNQIVVGIFRTRMVDAYGRIVQIVRERGRVQLGLIRVRRACITKGWRNEERGSWLRGQNEGLS
jgi:hypothetical protein